MRFIKRLDIFVVKNFLTLFAGTFCISLFVVMMQFLWRYVDELIGKGLSMMVLAKFLFYSGETLVPLALPLAILLASLISFGNMGERLELLSMKAAGIPLIRVLSPLIGVNVLLALASFYFQDNIMPRSEVKLRQLLFSMRAKSPELDIPEGVFYDGIQSVNMFVDHKDKETGMLYGLIIYNLKDGVNNAHIILADSGRLVTSYDKMHLLLHLWNGEQFENLNSAAVQARNVPYRRETFVAKDVLIDFDTNFNLVEEENFKDNEGAKNIAHLLTSIDSLENYYDSVGLSFYDDMRCGPLFMSNTAMARRRNFETGQVENIAPKDLKHVKNDTLSVDSMFDRLDVATRQRAVFSAIQKTNMLQMDTNYKGDIMDWGNVNIRRHWIAFWQKFTMSLSCLLFFFIGAPLGAIIRKGGLGMPVVISVIIFIFYYIINNSGMKVGREGSIPVWFGMWVSTFVMAPLGVFFTVKSNNDSVVFNKDAYVSALRRLWGIRQKRNITRKEVIINDPDYAILSIILGNVITECQAFRKTHRFFHLPEVLRLVFSKKRDHQVEQIDSAVEYLVDELSNSKDKQILLQLNRMPVLDIYSFRYYRRIRRDLKQVIRTSEILKLRCEELADG
ncbi:MAG: LptF/LptG family permease [Bacteroidaceae bacterium]|nr:LptF/LptG family permease [Bacteroidaceae bacterium]